jgi:Flp pilus assembly protein TadG
VSLLHRPLLNDRGNVAITFALSVLGMAVLVGGGVDMTRLSMSGSRLQDAADAAALSIATDVAAAPSITDTSVLLAKAQAKAANLIRSPLDKTRSTYGGAAAVEIVSRTPAQVRVVVSQPQNMMFGSVVGFKSVPLQRTAVAVSQAAYPVCLLVLDPDSSNAWVAQGTSNVTGPKCVAQVNSSSSSSLSSNGNASVAMLRTFVVGSAQQAGAFSPAPEFKQAVLADPLAAQMHWPTPTSCQALTQFKNTTQTLSPGTYCGGFDLATGANITLRPGTYVLKTGGVSVRSGAVLDGSSGVTLVLLDPAGSINMQAGGSVLLNSPKTGDWANVALAAKPQPTEVVSYLGGGGDTSLDGIVYLPSQNLHLTGGGVIQRADSPRTFVVNRLTTEGNGQIYVRGSSAMVMGSDTRLVR